MWQIFISHLSSLKAETHNTVRVTSSGQSHKTSSQGKMGKAVLHSTKRKPSSFWWMIGSCLQRVVPESKSKDWRALLQLACLQDKLLTWYILVWRMKKKSDILWTTTVVHFGLQLHYYLRCTTSYSSSFERLNSTGQTPAMFTSDFCPSAEG